MSKHTPGPWSQDKGRCSNCVYAESKSGFPVAKAMRYSPVFDKEYLANARLIAAAPDLLEACKAMMASPENDMKEYVAIQLIEKAIAKAEGEENEASL